jgi:hypothetical protein
VASLSELESAAKDYLRPREEGTLESMHTIGTDRTAMIGTKYPSVEYVAATLRAS